MENYRQRDIEIGTPPKTEFGGHIYADINEGTDDSLRTFSTIRKKLRDIVLLVKLNSVVFGDSLAQTYPVATNQTFGITQVDIRTLFFRNEVAGKNGNVHIFAVEE